MSIFNTNSTVIVDHVNGTIIGVVEIGPQVPYPVNVTELFAAFIAPLKYNPFKLPFRFNMMHGVILASLPLNRRFSIRQIC